MYLCLLHLTHRRHSQSLTEMLIMRFHYSYLDLGIEVFFLCCIMIWTALHDMKWRHSVLQSATGRKKPKNTRFD